MSREHSVVLNGREIRYFDVYDSSHLDQYREAQRQGALCVAVGPTGTGKTIFFDFAVASYWSCETLNLYAYGVSDIQRILSAASGMKDGKRLTVAFYLSRTRWCDARTAIEMLLDSSLGSRLAGVEITLESEHVNILDELRQFASERSLRLLEFPELDEEQRYAFLGWVMGFTE